MQILIRAYPANDKDISKVSLFIEPYSDEQKETAQKRYEELAEDPEVSLWLIEGKTVFKRWGK